MRITALPFSLLLVVSTALADTPKDPPRCTITEIRLAGDSGDSRSMSIDVPGVYAKGARWAEYNCRQDSRGLASSWVADHGGCAAGHAAFKYKVALGYRGSETMIDLASSCPKAASSSSSGSTSVSSPSSSGYHVGDKLSVQWQGKPYPATILRVVGPDQYFIHYDNFASKWNETVGPSRIVGSPTSPSRPSYGAPATPATSASTESDKDPVKCVVVRVKERDLGDKTTSLEIDWLKGQKYPDKIPASTQEILCKAQAMNPVIEWAKTNGLCGINIKYTVQFGHVSNPKSIDSGAICNHNKPLGH